MGKIFHIFGKSASGKDCIYSRLLNDDSLGLKPIITYTTRPMRSNETDGVQYHFVTEDKFLELGPTGKIIESRMYEIEEGEFWRYFSVDDGSIDLENNSYIVIGSLESYRSYINYFDYREDRRVIPIYIYIEDDIRLIRAVERERSQKNQNYHELCERFLRDEKDFSEYNLSFSGVGEKNRFRNYDLDTCNREVKEFIERHI